MGAKRIVGEVESHDKALRKYRQALEDGRVAGILEQDRADAFTQNLGNVPPKTAVEVEIRVLHPVAFRAVSDAKAAAEWEYRFPTVVGARYDGKPRRVTDRDRLDVDRAAGGTPVRLTLELASGSIAEASNPTATWRREQTCSSTRFCKTSSGPASSLPHASRRPACP